ncbi:hypothetical protein OSCT_0422 [Oscillochloris trichoides DG-6]|uniref:DUF4350 domain-containing protein n=1 Tax=Oscillochloris trichoides DG-6 TaxID=765420 RepID=E1IAS1_9CHLR|nr:hypothetical protein [Oscillochloris trichoides]EFO81677.1 hypothetical protein OSCT_0422 [Oscillochloris trichoides DG-6]
MLRLPRILLILLALFFLLPVGSLAAQTPPALTLDVLVGYDGAGQYHVSHWFPVRMVVANDGGDLRGSLEWTFAGEREPAFRYQIDLPRGARKEVFLPIVTNGYHRVAEVHLVVDGRSRISQSVRLTPIDTSAVLVGVLSSDLTLLNSLSSVELVPGYPTYLSHMHRDLVPDDAMLFDGLDVIVVHDLGAVLNERQRAALTRWVQLGGILLVSGGPDAYQTTTVWNDLLPVTLSTDLRSAVAVDGLERLAGVRGLSTVVQQGLTANAVDMRPNAINLDAANLITSIERGSGQVLFAAFDLSVLRVWSGEAQLWERILVPEPRMQMAFSFRSRTDNLLREALQLEALNLPAPLVIFCLITGYILVIGPLNFLVLRRMRRIDLAWITTPALVAFFLVGSYAVSFLLRGTQPQVVQLALVQSQEGVAGGHASAFVGLFSPQRRSYDLSFAPQALVSPGSFESYSFNPVPVTMGEAGVQIPDLLVDVSSLRTLLLEQPVEKAPTVTSQIERVAGQVRGNITNLSGETLYAAQIVRGATMQSVGDLVPGQEVDFNLPLSMQNFPDYNYGNTDPEQIFNRALIIYNLFNYDRFSFGGPNWSGAQGIPEPDAVYLLAWSMAPALEVAVDGDATMQQGMTLHLIRLEG